MAKILRKPFKHEEKVTIIRNRSNPGSNKTSKLPTYMTKEKRG